jgi:hypothetical protein
VNLSFPASFTFLYPTSPTNLFLYKKYQSLRFYIKTIFNISILTAFIGVFQIAKAQWSTNPDSNLVVVYGGYEPQMCESAKEPSRLSFPRYAVALATQ